MYIHILQIEGKEEEAFFNKDLAEVTGAKSKLEFTVKRVCFNDTEEIEVDIDSEASEVYVVDDYDNRIKIEVDKYEEQDEELTDIIPFTEKEIWTKFTVVKLNHAKIGNILIENLNVSKDFKDECINSVNDYIERLNTPE